MKKLLLILAIITATIFVGCSSKDSITISFSANTSESKNGMWLYGIYQKSKNDLQSLIDYRDYVRGVGISARGMGLLSFPETTQVEDAVSVVTAYMQNNFDILKGETAFNTVVSALKLAYPPNR